MTLYDPGHPSSLNNQGIKLNGVGLYLNPGTEVLVRVNSGNGETPFNEKVSIPVTSYTRATKLIFDHPVEFYAAYGHNGYYIQNGCYKISLSVQVTGNGSAKTTKDGEKTERTARVKTAMSETAPIKIETSKNSIIGELYFTSPSN